MRSLTRRAAWSAAVRLGLEVYDPEVEASLWLDTESEYTLDQTPIPDNRPSTTWGDLPDLTLLPEALQLVVEVARFRGARVLEVGPRYGVHSLWIDQALEPSELAFSDFAIDRGLQERWAPGLRCPHRVVWGDLRLATKLLELEPPSILCSSSASSTTRRITSTS